MDIIIDQRETITGETVYYVSYDLYFLGIIALYEDEWLFEANEAVSLSIEDLRQVLQVLEDINKMGVL